MNERESAPPERDAGLVFDDVEYLIEYVESHSKDGVFEGASIPDIKRFWNAKVFRENSEETEYPFKPLRLQERLVSIEEELRIILQAEAQIENNTVSKTREDGAEWTLTVPQSLHASLFSLILAESAKPLRERHVFTEQASN